MAELLKGAPVAAAITEALRPRARILKEHGIVPTLAIVRMGEKAGDLAYEHASARCCSQLGIEIKVLALPEEAKQRQLVEEIMKLNADASVHGCLIMRPLPRHIDENAVCQTLLPRKDVDCVTELSLSRVFSGHSGGFYPCTAEACLRILDYYGYRLSGSRISVVGRSLVVGRPLSIMLQDRDATVTMCHSRTKELAKVCRNKDMLIVAAGKANMIDENYVNQNQVVIDVGINDDGQGRITGDVNFAAVEPCVSAITPVPGGVGSVTASILAKHVIMAAENTLT